MCGGRGSIGPAWARGEVEKPRGQESRGTWTAAVYTLAQQARLNVDEKGSPVKVSTLGGLAGVTGPAWTLGQAEAPNIPSQWATPPG